MKEIQLRIGGMTCAACAARIEKALLRTPGVQTARVNYANGTAQVRYDPEAVAPGELEAAVERLDYQVLAHQPKPPQNWSRALGLLIIIAALFFLLQQFGVLNYLAPSRLAGGNMGYGMLFLIGLVTSVHCVAMCGGVQLTQLLPKQENKRAEQEEAAPRLLFAATCYNLGRVLAYTATGGVLGFVGWLMGGGNAEAGVPLLLQGLLKLAAGVFMILMGVNMLGIFPWLRKLQPHLPFRRGKKSARSPLIVGLLNGLMPCGPLQSIQIMALASGGPLRGALSMLAFALGTLPLMMGFGSLVSALGKKFKRQVMAAGAVLVVVLGLAMLTQGWNLAGFSSMRGKAVAPQPQSSLGADEGAAVENGVQVVRSRLEPRGYPNITVRAGIPVKWTMEAPPGSINGCNARLNIQPYGIENYALQTGENIIEFTPTEPGVFRYSCWMGMLYGTITVTQ